MSCIRITATDSDSPLISSPPPHPPTDSKIKRALRRLACSSPVSSDACTPASADWQGKRSRRRMLKQESRREYRDHRSVPSSSPAAASASASASASPDVVWCGPGFADDSVDCVVRHHAMMMMGSRGGRNDAERIHREIMMFQTRMMSGRLNVYDRYKDWRLDVDRMSYEELLELGDRIGYVNTGLREEEISRSLRKMKHPVLDASSLYFSPEMEKKCSICQEEYELNEEMGKLGCEHSYHMYCIKQWLLQKNACPVCKTAVTKT